MSKPERRSVLEGHLRPGRTGALAGEPVRLRELVLDACELTARRGADQALRRAAAAAFRLDLPDTGAWREGDGLTVLGVGPGSWLFLAAVLETERIAVPLGESAAVVEIGHGLVFLEMSGAAAPHVLSKGCRLDLHPSVFGSNRCARTIIAQIPTLLWRIDATPTFGLAFPSTFATSFLHFLLAASAEVGCETLSPRTE